MTSYNSEQLMEMEHTHGAHNYHPLEVVISKAEGIWVEDPEGKRYIDMLSAYSAVNQGHRHPAIIKALKAGDRKRYDSPYEYRRGSSGNRSKNHAQMGL